MARLEFILKGKDYYIELSDQQFETVRRALASIWIRIPNSLCFWQTTR